MRFSFGRTVERAPLVFAEGTFNEGRTFSLFGFGGYSQRELKARDELLDAAYDKSLFSETYIRNEALKDRIWQERLARIEHLTGRRLHSPVSQAAWATPRASEFFKENGLDERRWGDAHYRYEQHFFKKFKEQMAALAVEYPQHKDELMSFTAASSIDRPFSDEEMKGRAAASYERHRQAAATPYLTGWQKSKQEMAGSTLAFLSDPVSTGAMFIPLGGAAKGASVLARIGHVMLAEAAINAGTETLLQASTYQWRHDIGMDVSLSDSLAQIGTVAAIGGVVGGALRGAGEGVARLVVRGKAGRLTAADLDILAQELNIPVSDMERRLWQMAEAQENLGRAAFGEQPKGAASEDAVQLAVRALHDVHRGTDDVLLAAADYAPKRNPQLARILDDGFTPQKGEALEIAGRPVNYRQLQADQIGFDASIYQYKSGVDVHGVNGRLADVEKWEATGAGKVFVHQRKDGMFIVDGHQRLAAARRLGNGEGKIKLNAYVFNEKDGWRVEDVTALSARKNIGEGSSLGLDGAAAVRAWPELVDDGLPLATQEMKDMLGLARLSDDAWAQVASGAVREEYGAMVGRMVADESQHGQMLQSLSRAQPKEPTEAARLIKEALDASISKERPDGFRGQGKADIDGNADEPQFLKPQEVFEPATKQAAEMAERELTIQNGRLADKREVAHMWEDIAAKAVMDESFAAIQADMMAQIVRACKL